LIADSILSQIKINSGLEGRLDRNGEPLHLINGFMPFQWEGVEFLVSQNRAAYLRWDTGTGKTVAAEAAILIKRQEGFDLTLYVVKPNNLTTAQRKLKQHTGIDGYILSGTPKQREAILIKVDDDIYDGKQPVLILNAEKFGTDTDYFIELVTDRAILLVLDEAAKWGNRATKLYRATCKVFYTAKTKNDIFYPQRGYERASKMFSLALSATPLTKSPENLFNTVRLICPGLLGSITHFNNMYAGPRDQYNQVMYWRNLDHMTATVSPILHQVFKEGNHEVEAQFPETLEDTIFCTMDRNAEMLYSALQTEYSNVGKLSILSFDEILAAIGCLQMIASNPRAVLVSAMLREDYERELEAFGDYLDQEGIYGTQRKADVKEFERRYKRGSEVALKLRALIGNDAIFTDRDKKGNCSNGKLIQLKEFLDEHEGKAVVFTTEKVMQDLVAEWLTEWGIPHVVYHGALTQKNRVEAIDNFRQDEKIRVFLSTDAGQDSIDLPEASLTIHYDWPWSWSGVKQRENRQHRIDSEQDVVRVVTLTVPATVEDRKAEIVAKKQSYHRTIFEGAEEPEEVAKEDWIWVLTGEQDPDIMMGV